MSLTEEERKKLENELDANNARMDHISSERMQLFRLIDKYNEDVIELDEERVALNYDNHAILAKLAGD